MTNITEPEQKIATLKLEMSKWLYRKSKEMTYTEFNKLTKLSSLQVQNLWTGTAGVSLEKLMVAAARVGCRFHIEFNQEIFL